MIARADVVVTAKGWINPPTPFHHQASLKGVGADCVGLVIGIARELNIDGITEFEAAQEFKGYGREPTRAMLETGADRFLDRITLAEALPGDLLLLNSPLVRHPMHFAIISSLDPMYMIHANAYERKVVENRVDDAWRARIVRVYRYRGVA